MSHTVSPIQSALDQAAWVTATMPIRLFGDPILTHACAVVTEDDFAGGRVAEWARELTSFLTAYRTHTGTGRGLAANQIGIPKRAIVILYGSEHPEVLINPRITHTSGQGQYPESCISSASLIQGEVVRPWSVTVEYLDLQGKPHTVTPDDPVHARLLLHEIDHLEGRICSDAYLPGTMRIHDGQPASIMKAKMVRLA
jgi:peptide deformylase